MAEREYVYLFALVDHSDKSVKLVAMVAANAEDARLTALLQEGVTKETVQAVELTPLAAVGLNKGQQKLLTDGKSGD